MAATSVALLNASYEPLGKVTFQHAVRMLFRQVAIVEEAHDDRMIGPHPWPRVIRLVRGEGDELDVELVDRFGHDGISYTPYRDEAVRRVESGAAD